MPTQEWLAQYESVKEKTLSPVDLNQYFEREELAGKSLAVMDIGPCTLPTGRGLVRDARLFALQYYLSSSPILSPPPPEPIGRRSASSSRMKAGAEPGTPLFACGFPTPGR